MDDDNVVFLAFKNDALVADSIEMYACKFCRNKTFVLIESGPQDYPILRCAACTATIGKIGWHDAAPDAGEESKPALGIDADGSGTVFGIK